MQTPEEYLKENEFITNKHGNYIYSSGPHSFDLPTILQEYASAFADSKANHEAVLMPLKLTHEEGHKYLLIGEFYETIEVLNPDYCGCGKCDFCIDFADDEDNQPYLLQKVPISWNTIKIIYDKIFEFEKHKQSIISLKDIV